MISLLKQQVAMEKQGYDNLLTWNFFCINNFSRVLRRSIHNARLFHKNKKKPASEQYCMFYNRFGKIVFVMWIQYEKFNFWNERSSNGARNII